MQNVAKTCVRFSDSRNISTNNNNSLLVHLSWELVSRCRHENFQFHNKFYFRTPPVPYKCVTLGVDVQREGIKITAIGGYHHYRKDNMHVEKLEFVSSWSTHLPDGFGEFFPSLKEFEVRDTPLKKLKRSNFAAMNNLVILSIENTLLSSIPVDAFAEIVQLEDLKITKSHLRSLSPMTFAPLLKLRSFDGKYNRITRLDHDFFNNNMDLVNQPKPKRHPRNRNQLFQVCKPD